MKHAGLLAHSPDGAALAFSEFCHMGQRKFGEPLHPDITLDYIAMGRALPDWERGDLAAVRAVLEKSISRLAAAGAEFFFCADNTAHIALEVEGPPLAIPGLNLPDVVARAAKARGMNKLGVLGTRFTMVGPIYPRALGAQDIAWAIPDAEDRMTVDRIIFEELCNGVILDESQAAYSLIIDKFKQAGCDGAALVCTEIPLLISQPDSVLPILDSTRLIAEAAFNIGIGEAEPPTWRGGKVEAASSD